MLIKEKPDEVLIKEIKRQLSEGRQVVMCVKGRVGVGRLCEGRRCIVMRGRGGELCPASSDKKRKTGIGFNGRW